MANVNVSKQGIIYSGITIPNNNLLADSAEMPTNVWQYGSLATRIVDADGQVYVKLSGTSENWNAMINSARGTRVIPYSSIRNKQVTLSFEAKANRAVNQVVTFSLQKYGATARTKYFSFYSHPLTTDWKWLYHSAQITDELFINGTGDIETTDGFYIQVYNHTDTLVTYYRNFKLELSSLPTPWCLNSADAGQVGNCHGLIDNDPPSAVSIYDDHICAHDFIEW